MSSAPGRSPTAGLACAGAEGGFKKKQYKYNCYSLNTKYYEENKNGNDRRWYRGVYW